MGLPGALCSLNWPALVSGSVHVLSGASLIVLSKLVMSVMAFPFPATLTFLHHAGIALALWFWTLFGLFKPRRLPFLLLFHLGAGAALCALLSMLSLRYNSLAVYQAIRMSAVPTGYALERWLRRYRNGRVGSSAGTQSASAADTGITVYGLTPASWDSSEHQLSVVAATSAVAMFSALGFLVLRDPTFTSAGAVCGLANALSTALYQAWSKPFREHSKGTELQIQLYTKTLGALFLIPVVPFLDNYAFSSRESIFQIDISERTAIVILGTSLLAFLSFVAMRVSISRTTPQFYSALLSFIAALIFIADLEIHSDISAFPRKSCMIIILLAAIFLNRCCQAIFNLDQKSAANSEFLEEEYNPEDSLSAYGLAPFPMDR